MLRKRNDGGTALVFDIDPSVLIVPLMGMRELDIHAQTGAATVGRDYCLAPLSNVTCPMDYRRIRHEALSPESGEYFCIEEDDSIQAAPNQVPTLSNLLSVQPNRPQTAALKVSLGSRAFALPLSINADVGLMNLVASMGDSSGGLL